MIMVRDKGDFYAETWVNELCESRGRNIQAEGTASTNVMGQECPWCVV